ncbi:hypothetical protein [Nocardia cyriacigeorgica]|uniref:hypothetical protein n=1 Tax=Nocardia cyriacigeorgica TaxID=135487 RepID=UPI0024577CAA|nr:hypothetical protein [Nocardia cyriacigeorgica]
MSLFIRDGAPMDLRLGDENILRVHLGDVLVWDGATPVYVNAPPANGVSAVPIPALVVGVRMNIPATVGSGSAPVPGISGGVTADAPAPLGDGVAPAPAVSFGVTLSPPAAFGDGGVPAPSVGAIDIPPVLGSGAAPAPSVSGGATVPAPESTGAGSSPAPSIRVGVTASPPAALGTGTAPAPEVVTFSPMGMDKSGTLSLPAGTTATVAGWTVRSGYPGTVITGDALVSNGTKDVTIQCKVTLTSAWGSSTALTLRVLKNGVSIGTGSIAFNATSTSFSVSTSLVSGDQISLQYTTPFGASGTIHQGSTNTYLYYDPA